MCDLAVMGLVFLRPPGIGVMGGFLYGQLNKDQGLDVCRGTQTTRIIDLAGALVGSNPGHATTGPDSFQRWGCEAGKGKIQSSLLPECDTITYGKSADSSGSSSKAEICGTPLVKRRLSVEVLVAD